MEGISKDELIEVRKGLLSEGLNTDVIDALITLKVKELQEPWMTLEEFLKSGFVGLCWVEFPREPIIDAYFDGDFFRHSSTSGFIHNENYILRVQPIHKPEPPR